MHELTEIQSLYPCQTTKTSMRSGKWCFGTDTQWQLIRSLQAAKCQVRKHHDDTLRSFKISYKSSPNLSPLSDDGPMHVGGFVPHLLACVDNISSCNLTLFYKEY